MFKKRPCNGAALSMGVLSRNLEGFVYWDILEKNRMPVWVLL
jgi:hypothetical protein